MIFLIAGLVLFVLLVVAHEFGHFMAARRSGVEVEEFGIGFPLPIAFGDKQVRWVYHRKNGTEYSIHPLPLGGFVKLKGESADDKRPNSFGMASYWAKTKIMFAGVGMNILIAFSFFLVLAWTGLPVLIEDQYTVARNEQAGSTRILVGAVATAGDLDGDESPAEEAGLEPGNTLVSIDGRTFDSAEELTDYTNARPSEEVTIVYEGEGFDLQQTATVRLNETEEGEGRLGIAPIAVKSVSYTWAAPIVAAGITLQSMFLTVTLFFDFIANLFTQGLQSAEDSGIAGPVGLFVILRNVGEIGLVSYLFVLIASMSASLAALNAMPIPALDGGRWTLITIFRALKRPLTTEREESVNTVGFYALMMLIAVITFIDIRRF